MSSYRKPIDVRILKRFNDLKRGEVFSTATLKDALGMTTREMSDFIARLKDRGYVNIASRGNYYVSVLGREEISNMVKRCEMNKENSAS